MTPSLLAAPDRLHIRGGFLPEWRSAERRPLTPRLSVIREGGAHRRRHGTGSGHHRGVMESRGITGRAHHSRATESHSPRLSVILGSRRVGPTGGVTGPGGWGTPEASQVQEGRAYRRRHRSRRVGHTGGVTGPGGQGIPEAPRRQGEDNGNKTWRGTH